MPQLRKGQAEGLEHAASTKTFVSAIATQCQVDREIVRMILNGYLRLTRWMLSQGVRVNLYGVGTLELKRRVGRRMPESWVRARTRGKFVPRLVQPDSVYVKFKTGPILKDWLKGLDPKKFPKAQRLRHGKNPYYHPRESSGNESRIQQEPPSETLNGIKQ